MSRLGRVAGRAQFVALAVLSLAMATAVGPGAGAVASTTPSLSATTMFSTGSTTVAGMSIAPDGRVFYVGQASGKIFVWSPATHQVTTFATIPGATGVYGVAVSPKFATNHYLYAYASVTAGGQDHEVLVRYTEKNNVGQAFTQLRTVGVAGSPHFGGKILFGPKGGSIFLVVGDAGNPANSQDPTIDQGKILRLTALGLANPGNPGFADPAVWATGIRNSMGMANDPATGRLWETENGPECNDELNRVVAGGNYGWGPTDVCDGTAHGTNQDGANPIQPVENISSVVAPTGATFCNGCGIPEAANDLVYGRYLTDDLRSVTLNAARSGIVSDDLLFQDDSGVLAVESSPVDGSIWFADGSNNVKRLSEVDTQNLVQNPSFETSLAGWDSHNGTLTRLQTSDPAPGGGSFYAHNEWVSSTNYGMTDTDTAAGLTPTVTSATAGATYTATAYVRGTIDKKIHILLREKTPKGALVLDTGGTKTSLTSDWTQITVTATVQTTGDSLGMRIEQDHSVPGDTFDADVLVLERVS